MSDDAAAAGVEHPGWGPRALGLAASGAGTALLMVVMYLRDASFFLVQDKANQYLPVARDIGRRLTSGEGLPVIDPNLGPAGNYSLDIQYGLFDPAHLLVAVGLSRISNLQLAAFVWALAFEVLLAVGTSAVGVRLGMGVPWASAAGFAAATSGWVFFKLAPCWIPGLVSLAWLPWLWWSWVGREGVPRIRDCLGIALFAYLVVAGGWPATWLAFAALLAGLVVESVRNRDRAVPIRATLEPLAVRAVACVAGVVSAGLCLLPLFHALPYTERTRTIRNSGFLTGNLADMLSFAAPTLHGDIRSFGGVPTITIPIYFAVWFAVVVLWCVRWNRDLWRRPGLVTCVVGGSAMLLLTQAPSSVGPLRDQIRELSGAQFFFAVAICSLAGSGSWVVTRNRVLGVLLSLAAMGWLSWARDPGGPTRVIGILTVAGAAVLLLLVASRRSRWAAATALVTTFGLTLLAFLAVWATYSPATQPKPDRETAGRLGLTLADEPIFAVYGSGSQRMWDRAQADGVGHAFSDLRAGARISPGYSSIGQAYFGRQLCTVSLGTGCPSEAVRLFQREPTTGAPWADLLGYRTIVVSAPALKAFESAAPGEWHQVTTGAQFTEYRRTGPAAVSGRVTHVVGQAQVVALALSNETQSYRVSTRTGALLVFRDLYWPGYVATLDGRPIPVTPLHNTLLSVRLPAGSSGVLRVGYVPLSTRALVGLPATSAVLLVGACGWGYRRRRAWRPGEHEPDALP